MKKIYFILSTAMVATAANAQTPVTDSVQSGSNYANEVWYSFANGKVSEAPAADWQVAFQIGTFTVGARTNSASSTKAVTLYQSPEADTSKWSNFDTAGYTGWTQNLNSATTWSTGAFNAGASGANYGWGTYDQNTHNINGTTLYLAKYGTTFKRVFIKSKELGTWNIRISDIDGSNAQAITIPAGSYSTKNFVYVGLDNGNILDIEPANTAWDFVLTRYHADLGGGMLYPTYGILHNSGIRTAEVRGKEETTTTLADTATNTFNTDISTIGYDWKNTMLTAVIDSLSYFVKVKNGDIYKLVFTYVESGSSASGKNGKIIFNKTLMPILTANPTSLSFVEGGESKSVAITSNNAWTAAASDAWITLSATSGSGNANVNVTTSANSGASRTGNVTFTLGTLTAVVSVSQAGVTPPLPAGTDSIQSGVGYANEVWYSFATGKVKESPAADWQLAFSIGTFNVSARTNSASSTKAVTLYQSPETDTAKWSNFDTTNYTTWNQNLNSPETWDEGAFNVDANTSTGDYGWGQYDQNTHIISGHRMYLAKYGTSFKRVFIANKTLGTWNIRISDINGSNSKAISIASPAYSTKNFAYVGLDNGNVLDIEPANNAWDFVLTRSHIPTPDGLGGFVLYPSYCILHNAGIEVAEVRGKDETVTTLADTVGNPFSDNISTIGADWKNSLLTGVIDSLSYFVKVKNGDIYKLVFTYVESGSTASGKNGKVRFIATKMFSVGLANVNAGSIRTFEVYPNPASGSVNVLVDADENSSISIMDLNGKTVRTSQANVGFTATPVDLSGLTRGIYIITVRNAGAISTKKLVVE